MKRVCISPRELVERVYADSGSEKERAERIGLLEEGMRRHRKARKEERKAQRILGELMEVVAAEGG